MSYLLKEMGQVWKLLREHISIHQLAGFFFANLLGLFIVLLCVQAYHDIKPLFTAEDSFMKGSYMILHKQVNAATTLSGRSNSFATDEVEELRSQPFVKSLGSFSSTNYKVEAFLSINGKRIFNAELSFESVPDEFVDINLGQWKFHEGEMEVPVILPRTYITMYNFGFAQSHSLPKVSEGLMSMVDFDIFIQGNGHEGRYKGKVIGFSNRLNAILVPQSFMDWSNGYYANSEPPRPTRIILEMGIAAHENIAQYLDEHGYEVDNGNLDAEKTLFFLRMMVVVVMVIGLLISALSFYILMLSIYLLVQKNADKLENLLLIGYSPSQVSRPYIMLAVALNVLVLIVAWGMVCLVRNYYMGVIETLYPYIEPVSMSMSILVGMGLLLLVCVLDILTIRGKIKHIWHSRH